MHVLLLQIATSIDVHSLPGANTAGGNANSAELRTILSLVFNVVGAISLLVITLSGLRYIISNGDPKNIAQAKDGIIYALIGLVIAISAQAIVVFVIGNVG